MVVKREVSRFFEAHQLCCHFPWCTDIISTNTSVFVWTASSQLWQTALAMCFYPLATHFLCVMSSDHQTLINQPETPSHPLTSSLVVMVMDIWLQHRGRLCVCASLHSWMFKSLPSYPLPSRECSIQTSRLLSHVILCVTWVKLRSVSGYCVWTVSM